MRLSSVTALLACAAVSLTGCIETGITPDPPRQDDPVDEEEPTGGEKGLEIPDGIPIGGVKGTICAEPEVGLEGAIVAVEHEWGVSRVATDAEGGFVLDELPAGPHVLVVSHDAYNTQLAVDVPRNEVITVIDEECIDDCGIPVPCMGLKEAVDRLHARIEAGPDGTVEITNVGSKYSICLDEWSVVFSDYSQDAILGQDPGITLGPGESHVFDYAQDVYDQDGTATEAWWCVEQFQVIDSGVPYSYNGSLAPDILFGYVQDRTDTNVNGVEDHADVNFEGRIQTQLNIWNTERVQSILLVGRKRTVARLEDVDDTATLTVEARNLGQRPLSGSVFETVPRGFIVLDTSPPGVVTVLETGDTTIRWDVDLEGAEPVEGDQAIYDEAWLSYTIGVDKDDRREGRIEGTGVYGSWVDTWDRDQGSWSEPLILEVCPEGVDEQ